MSERLGRNDPCWCGSGKKYKRCHLEQDEGESGSAGGKSSGVGSILGGLGFGSSGRGVQSPPRRDPLALDEEEREAMRRACRFNAELMDVLRPHVQPGVATEEIDRIAYEYTKDHGHTPACLGYMGTYPKSTCISIDEVVCHGIPDARRLEEGSIANVDITTIVDGWYGDQSETFLIGEVDARGRELVQVTFECLHLAIEALEPNCRASVIGEAIVEHAHAHGFSVVREYQGHGIGRRFHQEPSILHYPNAKMRQTVLRPGHCFTIEPMINEGVFKTELDDHDGWTVRTLDRKRSAQFEHTILLTETGPEILTPTRNGPQRDHVFWSPNE